MMMWGESSSKEKFRMWLGRQLSGGKIVFIVPRLGGTGHWLDCR
jgi:hypothetical protein